MSRLEFTASRAWIQRGLVAKSGLMKPCFAPPIDIFDGEKYVPIPLYANYTWLNSNKPQVSTGLGAQLNV